MSRQENFKEASQSLEIQVISNPWTLFEKGCEYGYQYALQHHQWIPVEKELPKYDVEENGLITYPYEEVLVSLYDGYVDTDTYDTQLKAWWKYEGEVEYWMPKPQPPRKEE